MQACKNDFYFSHRIFFCLKSVTFEAITDTRKAETQRQAVDTILKSIYEMISAAGQTKDGDFYVERLFLPNSRDLVRLLVNFNMVQFHPQLKDCAYAASLNGQSGGMPAAMAQMDAQNMRSASGTKLARKIQQWQAQRLRNVQSIVDEYNL